GVAPPLTQRAGSMTVRGWRSIRRRPRSGKCRRRFRRRRSKPRGAQPTDVAKIEQVRADQRAQAAADIGERRGLLAREQWQRPLPPKSGADTVAWQVWLTLFPLAAWLRRDPETYMGAAAALE